MSLSSKNINSKLIKDLQDSMGLDNDIANTNDQSNAGTGTGTGTCAGTGANAGGLEKDIDRGDYIRSNRLPPVDINAEKALLATILRNNNVYEETSLLIGENDFFRPAHRKIYDVISKTINSGGVADHITIKRYFENDKDFLEECGKDYITNLVYSDTTILNATEYAKLIKDLSIRRELINIGEEVVNKSYQFSVEDDASDLIEEVEGKLYNLSDSGSSEKSVVSFGRGLQEVIKQAEIASKSDRKIIGITTGLRDLDEKLGGLHPSDLLILAGRPSMGKTALATNIAFNAAREYLLDSSDSSCGGAVAFFSLEMSAEQLIGRLLSAECKIPTHKIRNGELKDGDFTKFVASLKDLNDLQLFIDDTPGLSISALRTKARRLKRRHNISLIIVDYLQLLSGSGRKISQENRVQELSEITRGLKFVAKELSIPVLALSQLSRNVESRDDKRPMLSDLRESGSIEQDADVVMFVYRDEYYLSRKKPDESSKKYEEWEAMFKRSKNIAEVIIAKQRHGPIGIVPLHFEGEFTTFSDLEESAKSNYYKGGSN